jgi:hypothetical protein
MSGYGRTWPLHNQTNVRERPSRALRHALSALTQRPDHQSHLSTDPARAKTEVAVAAECGETGTTEARTAERRRVTLEILLCGDRRQTIQPAIDGRERPIQKSENQAPLVSRSRSSATRSEML